MGETSTISIEISPTPPLIFTEGQKCEICRSKMQQTKAQYCLDRPMSSLFVTSFNEIVPLSKEIARHEK